MTVAVIAEPFRPLLEGRLPDWVEPRFFAIDEEFHALAPQAEIGWFDSFQLPFFYRAAEHAGKLKWLNTMVAGVDPFPLELLRTRGVIFTNGSGIHAIAVAEYAVLGMLTIAKGWREVVRAQGRREWLTEPPGKMELAGSSALIVGAGAIGGRIGEMLRPWGVTVAEVRRHPAPGALGPEEWRARLGEFDWVVLAVPSTADTEKLIGAAELAAMKPTAAILNFARGEVIDQPALVEALREKRIGAAFLDVTDPEPLPPDHPLWSLDNCHISMHVSGRAQEALFARAADRFLDNLGRWERGEALVSVVDLSAGY